MYKLTHIYTNRVFTITHDDEIEMFYNFIKGNGYSIIEGFDSDGKAVELTRKIVRNCIIESIKS